MKKFFAFMAVAVLVLAGCAGGGGSSENSLTIFNLKPEIDEALKKYAADYEAETGVKVTIKTCGGGCDYGSQLKSEFQSGSEPDIFVIQGENDYVTWEHKVADLSAEPWSTDTEYAFVKDGKTYGFPYSVEGYGIIYNKDMMDKAGVDVSTLTTYEGWVAAVQKIDEQKEALGIDSVISMAAGPTMTWLTGSQNFNAYLANGEQGMKYVDEVLAGTVDDARLAEYANWVELLFNNANQQVLNTGNYDEQVNAFKNGKTAFIAQGNWIAPNMADATFEMGIAPMGSKTTATDGIFVSAPSFYAVNKDGANVELAKKFLNDMVSTDRGVQFIVEDAQMVPAFKSIKAEATNSLNQSVIDWVQKGNNYGWDHYYMPDGFCNNTLGAIYSQYANKQITKEEFIKQVSEAIKTLQ
ncbi:ABC transporter substrate-binding protein [Culicoidibacter larvae]|uniref:Carbohydrate ABC transporter substrate-binding protein n=1 Tax=Culicoidibacter larvae TaxID=2579976 RepID=A0A5R8QAT2_9FIRM|nr:ABC transporter substrate-binding protein [Culicoidibacter larvae]TLG72769.1 carbohydrate ABC transporter substrate-binding protein [Culicoidibacter larvae]